MPGAAVDNGALYAEERRREIVTRLSSAGKVTVEDLAASFHVSLPTIRADLARLEEQGLIRRTHGGAIPANPTLFEPPYAQRQVMRQVEKRAIARAAVQSVRPGETLLLDAGTTTYEIAVALQAHAPLTVVTNSLPNAATLMSASGIEVILVGGQLQPWRKATLGPLAIAFLDAFRVDRAFLAFNGVDTQAGFTVVDFTAAEIKRRMAERAGEVIAVMDSGKVGKVAFAQALPLGAVALLLTDSGIPDGQRRSLEAAGLPVRAVPL